MFDRFTKNALRLAHRFFRQDRQVAKGAKMRAWLFQDSRQRKRLGDKAPWSVGWIDQDGKRRSKRIGSKSQAEKYRRKLEGEMAAGLYKQSSRKSWKAFREEYKTKIMPRLAIRTRDVIEATLNHFERLSAPQKVSAITTQTIDDFVAKRQTEQGKKKGSTVSPATVNRDLRHLKATLRVAHDWGYLPKVPKFRKVREPDQIGPVITPAHFEAIYGKCDVATMPRGLACEPGDWWRALLVFALTTGWRIEEILSLRRQDLDLKTGAILTRAADNKGRRDDRDYLPEAALVLVRSVAGFEPLVFFWPHHRRTLDLEFKQIQQAAEINLPCPQAGNHECTDACHLYGFHALRRAYATLNADSLPAPVLQKKMRHRSFTTTLRYIALADKMKKSSEKVYVPDFLQRKVH